MMSMQTPRPKAPRAEGANLIWTDSIGAYLDVQIETRHGSATQRMRWINPGTFMMGSPESEPERFADEGPRHAVTISKVFWLADTACTQAMWRAVMGFIPGHFQGDEWPVEGVSWYDVQDFLRELDAVLPGVALPTEAQWEYACRAGTDTPFSFGAQITPEQANYDGNYPYAGGEKGLYRGQPVPVKSLPPNAWGLYEMHGNVWEWCADEPREYTVQAECDPVGSVGKTGYPAIELREYTVRGGSWRDDAYRARSANRSARYRSTADQTMGFRFMIRRG